MLQFLPLLMQAGGAVGGALSAYYGARAEKSRLGFEADMADINARMAERTAERTLESGRREVQRSRMQTAGLKGRQIAAMGANGIALDEGSAVQVLAGTDYLGEFDTNAIEANAIAQAWGHRIEATNIRSQARSTRAAARAISPGRAALTSIIGSAGSVASSWYSMNKVGAFDTPTKPPANSSPNTSGLNANTASLGGFWGSK
jgi:hypothetical protein